jgi:hypothetical protein
LETLEIDSTLFEKSACYALHKTGKKRGAYRLWLNFIDESHAMHILLCQSVVLRQAPWCIVP